MNYQPNSKPHFPILDGLRGTAALLVVIFHLFEGFDPSLASHPMRHGYLAVDFFFLLSGFVVGYAYDDRWERMSLWEFIKIRLVRLHPLVILAVVIGAIGYWADPFIPHANLLKFTVALLLSFTLLPSPDLRGWGETHSLVGPCWSLLQEYIGNLIYALFGRKIGNIALGILVGVSGIALAAVAIHRGDIGTGWSYETFWIAVVRMMYPFFAGLLLYRMGKLIKIPYAYTLCSLMLILLFCVPYLKFNGIYEAACVIMAFPLIVAAGAGGQINGRWKKLCDFSGAISYPIYILHYPFIYIYTEWVQSNKPSPTMVLPIAIGLFLLFIAMAYASLKLYDEPLRAWLKKKVL